MTLYGVALERNTPGVVYDTLGMLGGTVHHITLFHEDAWIAGFAESQARSGYSELWHE